MCRCRKTEPKGAGGQTSAPAAFSFDHGARGASRGRHGGERSEQTERSFPPVMNGREVEGRKSEDPRENGDRKERNAAMLRENNPRRRGAPARIRENDVGAGEPKAGRSAGLEAGGNSRSGRRHKRCKVLQ